MRRVLALLLLLPLTACTGHDGSVDLPKGVTFQVEQSRQDLTSRRFGLQVVNHGSRLLTISRIKLTSGRLDEASIYRGPATVAAGATVNLIMSMSRARCGSGIDASAEVSYHVGNSPAVTSVVRPKDHYGSVALFMKRDCARGLFDSVVVGPNFEVDGLGADSVLRFSLLLRPKAGAGRIRIGPLDGTTLLKPTDGGNVDHVLESDETYRAELEVIPDRCDAHAVAEDRTGAAMPLHLDSKTVGRAFFFVVFDAAQKAKIFDFIAAHCGLGVAQDPLLAP